MEFADHITDAIDNEIENYVMDCIQKVAVNVDREELLKALRYDRNQYEKGYADGRISAINVSYWIDRGHYFMCANCNGVYSNTKYCPNCGAEMKGVKQYEDRGCNY